MEKRADITSSMHSRIPWVDVAKFYGIFMVIIGHSNPPFILNILIYSFHMPLFFFLSGYTFKQEYLNHPIDFLKSKIRGILIPYFFLSFIMFCWMIFKTMIFHSGSIGSLLVNAK